MLGKIQLRCVFVLRTWYRMQIMLLDVIDEDVCNCCSLSSVTISLSRFIAYLIVCEADSCFGIVAPSYGACLIRFLFFDIEATASAWLLNSLSFSSTRFFPLCSLDSAFADGESGGWHSAPGFLVLRSVDGLFPFFSLEESSVFATSSFESSAPNSIYAGSL
jgi:hypothetical protein